MKVKRIIKIPIIVGIVLVIMILIGFNPFLPIYERLGEDGTMVIDGVRYQMMPSKKWTVDPGGDVIGYAGSWYTDVTMAADDPGRNFVFLIDLGWGSFYGPLYRTDKDIPEPSADSIDKLLWSDDVIGSDYKGYSKIVEDKDIIKDLFDSLNTGKKVGEIKPLHTAITMGSEKYSLNIYCYSSALPYARYDLHFGLHDGKIICSDYKELFVEVPKELLEKIAGKSLNIEGYKP